MATLTTARIAERRWRNRDDRNNSNKHNRDNNRNNNRRILLQSFTLWDMQTHDDNLSNGRSHYYALLVSATGCSDRDYLRSEDGGTGMTVGELIMIMCKFASDEDDLLMAKSIDDIEIRGDKATLYFTDGNTSNVTLYKDGRWRVQE